MIYVLDASAMVACFRRERGAELVEDVVADQANESFAHSLNLVEVFYDFRRSGGESEAQRVIRALADLGVHFRSDFGTEFWQSAAGLCPVTFIR